MSPDEHCARGRVPDQRFCQRHIDFLVDEAVRANRTSSQLHTYVSAAVGAVIGSATTAIIANWEAIWMSVDLLVTSSTAGPPDYVTFRIGDVSFPIEARWAREQRTSGSWKRTFAEGDFDAADLSDPEILQISAYFLRGAHKVMSPREREV